MKEYFKQCCVIVFLPDLIVIEDDKILNKSINSVRNLHKVTNELAITKHVYYNQSIEEKDVWENDKHIKLLKQGADQGAKLQNAFQYAFECGFRKVILIKSEYEGISSTNIIEAFKSLRIIEFCIGPDTKGGYYLIGMKQFEPVIFNNKDWNSDHIYKSTLSDLGKLKYSLYKLPILK